MVYTAPWLRMSFLKEGNPQKPEFQSKELLTINQVLDVVYDEVVAGIDPQTIVRRFDNDWCQWDSHQDIDGASYIYFHFSGILFETERNKAILLAKSDEREQTWFSSQVKVVAWTRLEVGRDSKYKIQIRDYPNWQEVPLDRLIHSLPKNHSELSFRPGGILVNQRGRLALNGVIPMQPKFVAQKETVDPNVVRGPGGIPIILDGNPRRAGEMYADDMVVSGTLYKPGVVSYIAEKIKKDFSRKPRLRNLA